MVLTHFPVFSAEVVFQTCYQALQSCLSFLIPVVFLSLQHKYSIEKAELLTEIVSSLVISAGTKMQHTLIGMNKMELGSEEIFPSCPCFISLWALHCTVVELVSFSTSEKMEDLSVHTCPIYLQRDAEF